MADEKDVREKQLKGFMMEVLKQSIQIQMQKYVKRDVKQQSLLNSEDEAYQPESIAIKVAIEFCLNIGAVEFLFHDMMSIFD